MYRRKQSINEVSGFKSLSEAANDVIAENQANEEEDNFEPTQ
jgi:hypothetical protein